MSNGLQRIFNKTASTYEMINHLLTLGLDMLWRKKVAELVIANGGSKWLDVCSGTGELAACMQRTALPDTQVVAADFSYAMLREAQKKKEFQHIQQVLAESGRLPFKNNSFDIVTISYATRNLCPTEKRLMSYLQEFHRVLKPGGVFVNLETSQPRSPTIRRIYHLYVKLAVAKLGSLISGSKSGYRYLAYSVQRFYDPFKFAAVLRAVGFRKVGFKSFLFGAFAIHQAIA